MRDKSFPISGHLKLYRSQERVNGFGDVVHGYADAPVKMPVVGWYATGGSEPGEDGRLLQVDYDAVVFVPSNVKVRSSDRIEVPGIGICDVDGPAGNWDHGPWWNPGVEQFHLRRSSRED